MTPAALIVAAREAEGAPAGLRAALPLAGFALVEHQLRIAARAGASPLILLAERLPAELSASIERVRRDGIAVIVAREPRDAAGRIDLGQPLLLIGDGVLPDLPLVERMLGQAPPALLSVADGPETACWERIDRDWRWAGLALLDGATLARTAAMLGEWDLESTLLRQAASEGATRIDVVDPAAGATAHVALVDDAGTAGEVGERMIRDSRRAGRRWTERYLFGPVEEPAVRALMGRPVESLWLRLGATLAATAAMPLFLLGFPAWALGALLLSGPIDAVGCRLGAVRGQTARYDRFLSAARRVALGGAALSLGLERWLGGQGIAALLLAATTIAFLVAAIRERPLAHRTSPSDAAAPWLAHSDAMAWAALPFALLLGWDWSLAATTAYAAATFFRLQHVARRGV